MAHFLYDVSTLIELIESEPCLWNKSHCDYRNKTIREQKWEKVFQHLDERYADKTVAEKKKTAEVIMRKWTNIRDAFKSSSKLKRTQTATKPYLYAEQLQFLLKPSESAETPSNCNEEASSESNPSKNTSSYLKQEDSSSESCFRSKICYVSEDSLSEPCPSPKSNSKGRKFEDYDDEIKCEILPKIRKPSVPPKPTHPPKTQNPVRKDHEILLLSFSTYIRDMTEEELMEFQMETLKTIRNIKRKRASAASSLSTAQSISFSSAYFK